MSQVRFVDSSITVSPGVIGEPSSDLTGSLLTTASISGNNLTFTKGDESTFTLALPGSGGGGDGIFSQTGSFYATTNDLQISGSLRVTGSYGLIGTPPIYPLTLQTVGGGIRTVGTLYIDADSKAGTTARIMLGTSNTNADIARLTDNSLVIGGETQYYGWRIFGIKHGANGGLNNFTTEIDNLIATGSMRVSGSLDISLQSGSAFTITEEDIDQENRLTFEYDQGDPTLIIAGRAASSSLHLKYNLAGDGLKITNQGLFSRTVSGVDYEVSLNQNAFQPTETNQLDLGYYNRRWKNLYLYNDNKISWGISSPTDDSVSIRHNSSTNKLTITGSSDVTLDVKGNIVTTGSLELSGSMDISLPSGSAFKIRESDKNNNNDDRLEFEFIDGDPTLRIISDGTGVSTIRLQDEETTPTTGVTINQLGQFKLNDDNGFKISNPTSTEFTLSPIVGAPSANVNDLGDELRPWSNLYTYNGIGYSTGGGKPSFNSKRINIAGENRDTGLFNFGQMSFQFSGSLTDTLENPVNHFFGIRLSDDYTPTSIKERLIFSVGKSGSLGINLRQGKTGFGSTYTFYTASAMVHVEAEPNYNLNLFQGNDVLGNSVFYVDRIGEISASGDIYARDGRFSRDGIAEIEVLSSDTVGGIVGTHTNDNLILRRFNIPKLTISESRTFSHQKLEVQGDISASGDITTKQIGITGSAGVGFGFIGGGNENSDVNIFTDVPGEINFFQSGVRAMGINSLGVPSPGQGNVMISDSFNLSGSALRTASFGHFVGDGSGLTGIDTGSWNGQFSGSAGITGSLTVSGSLEVQSGTSRMYFESGSSAGSDDGKILIKSTGGPSNISLWRTDGVQAALLTGTGGTGFYFSDTGYFGIQPTLNPAEQTSFTGATALYMEGATGKVGINTNNPLNRFYVAGIIGTNSDIIATGSITSSGLNVGGPSNFESGSITLDKTTVPSLPGDDDKINIGTGGSGAPYKVFQIYTNGGYVQIGPENDSYSHFLTDRPKFYFNKPLQVSGEVMSHNDEDLVLGNNGGTSDTITIAQNDIIFELNNQNIFHMTTGSAGLDAIFSGSATSTASFGTYLGDGSQLTGIETFPYTGSAIISGSLGITGSLNIVEGTAQTGISNFFAAELNGSDTIQRIGSTATGLEFHSDTQNTIISSNQTASLSGYETTVGALLGTNVTRSINLGVNNTLPVFNNLWNIYLGGGQSDTKLFIGASTTELTGSLLVSGSTGLTGPTTITGSLVVSGSVDGIYSPNLIKAQNIIRVGEKAFFRESPAILHLGLGSSTCAAISTERDCIHFRVNSNDGFGSDIPFKIDQNYIYAREHITGSSITLSGSLLCDPDGLVSIDHTDSPYTITGAQQFILINPQTNNVQINIPDATTYPGREIKLKLTEDSGANTVTLQCQGSDTIDGAASNTTALEDQYEAISIVSDGGTGWFIF